jgi:hypothetical protein
MKNLSILISVSLLLTSCRYFPDFMTECPFCTKVCVDIVDDVAEDIEEELTSPEKQDSSKLQTPPCKPALHEEPKALPVEVKVA